MAAILLVVATIAIGAGNVKKLEFDTIKAKEIVAVDGNGVVRARLGGDLPDAVMANGHVAKRDSKAGGLLIYDEQGIERGGYATMDSGSNAVLTLDSKHRQAVLLIAEPDAEQSSALRLWSGNSAVELRSNELGSRMSISDAAGVVSQLPAVEHLPEAVCDHFKELKRKYPEEAACRRKYLDSTCAACLER